MVPFVDRQILDAAIVPEFPDRDAAIGQIEALLHVNQAKMENGLSNVYFTERALATTEFVYMLICELKKQK